MARAWCRPWSRTGGSSPSASTATADTRRPAGPAGTGRALLDPYRYRVELERHQRKRLVVAAQHRCAVRSGEGDHGEPVAHDVVVVLGQALARADQHLDVCVAESLEDGRGIGDGAHDRVVVRSYEEARRHHVRAGGGQVGLPAARDLELELVG